MKNKILVALALVAAAAISGGGAAWLVARAGRTARTTTSSAPASASSGGFEGVGAHFTSYTPQNYPDLTYAAENAVKAVVGVINTQEIPARSMRGGYGSMFEEFFGIPEGYYDERGGGGDSRGGSRQQQSGGSGVIISPDGYIVTNHHVVEGATKLTVKLPDGKTHEARLVGTDADTEIALLKIEAAGLPSLPFGNSDELRLGEWVLAIGNPYDLRSTVTAGIVSAKGRSLGAIQTASGGIESFIQTDAAVNPGNSGGALVNTAGELVGINTLLYSRTGSYSGYSFAVPETIVRKVVADLKEYGVVQRALLGIGYRPVDEQFLETDEAKDAGIDVEGGIYVSQVIEDGAARAAGIREGDVITSMDGVATNDGANVAGVISRKRPGDTVKISVKRGASVKQFNVVLRNKAGKSELLPANSYDAVKALGGEFRPVTLSAKEKRSLGIDGGLEVVSVNPEGLLARIPLRRGYIITHINDREVLSVSDLNRITKKITSIGVIDSNGRARTYMFDGAGEGE